MAKRLHIVSVRGTSGEWVYETYVDPKHAAEQREDGIEIHAVENTVPARVVDAGLARAWCFFQDLLHFKMPGRG